MAWSYRTDRLDEVYSKTPGVTLVEGEDLPDSPASSADAAKMLKPEKKEEGVTTQFQEHPGQDVPRVIVGEGETKKDKEIVEAVKAREKEEKEQEKANKKEEAHVAHAKK